MHIRVIDSYLHEAELWANAWRMCACFATATVQKRTTANVVCNNLIPVVSSARFECILGASKTSCPMLMHRLDGQQFMALTYTVHCVHAQPQR